MKSKLIKSDYGFTLVELMTVMAIIGILATAIMVSLSAQKKRAEGNKALLELSDVMNKIYLCKSDDGTVNNPSDGGDICSLGAEYGFWPNLNYLGSGWSYGGGTNLDTSSWFYSAFKDGVGVVCCNSKYTKCNLLDSGSCSKSTVLK